MKLQDRLTSILGRERPVLYNLDKDRNIVIVDDFTLAEVLMAIRKTIIGYMLYPTPDENIVAINVKEKEICIFYNLTKTLFQQEQSTIDSIAKIMGG